MNCTSQERDFRCDGNGYFCLPQGVCICDVGWTALGAFSTTDGIKCDINKNSIYGLNIIDSVMALAYLLLILEHLMRRFMAVRDTRLFLHDPKTLCSFTFLLVGISDLVMSLSAILYEERQLIGKDSMVSYAASIFTLFCFVGLSAYFQIMVHFLKNSSRLMTASSRYKVISRLTVLRNLSWAIIPLSIPICLSTIFCWIYPEHARSFAMTAIIGIGVMIFYYNVLFLTALGFIVAELSAYLDTAQVQLRGGTNAVSLVCRRLKFVYKFGGASLFGGALLMILCGSWDFLFRKFAYINILLRLNSILFFTLLFITISGVASGNVTSKLMTVRSAMTSRKSIEALFHTGQSTKASGDRLSGASHKVSNRRQCISSKIAGLSQRVCEPSPEFSTLRIGRHGASTKKSDISLRLQGLSSKLGGASHKIHSAGFEVQT